MSDFTIKSKEFGRGPAHVESFFSTLAGVVKYIKGQWQGADYIDGDYGFHTDYCTFSLGGFTLKDIGDFTYPDDGGGSCYREFTFKPELIEAGNALCDACCKRPAKFEAQRRLGNGGEKVHVCKQCGIKGDKTYYFGKEAFEKAVREGKVMPWTYVQSEQDCGQEA